MLIEKFAYCPETQSLEVEGFVRNFGLTHGSPLYLSNIGQKPVTEIECLNPSSGMDLDGDFVINSSKEIFV